MPAGAIYSVRCVFLLLGIVALVFEGSTGLRSVNLILPSVVQAGGSATLFCLYDLEGASLYSVQWYRGRHEFFRFLPNENPSTKAFQIPGLSVDTFVSNKHQVTLRDISVHVSGEFRCEVTTDAPKFSTSYASNNLTVVDVLLTVPKQSYQFGDIVTANCSLTQFNTSKKLKFHWNIHPEFDNYITTSHSNWIVLKLNTSDCPTGTFIRLSCSVWLDNGYHVTSKSVSLDVGAKKPAEEISGARMLFLKQQMWLIFYAIIIFNN